MIQDTAWSPRFVASTTATAATSADVNAGTDTNKFITPAALAGSTPTLTLTDVILGTSGPSVKSTLSARAPRQGLVFDSSHGTTYATVTNIPAFGQGIAGSTSGDFTFAAWVREESTFAGTPIVVIGNAAGGFYCEFNPSGIPYVGVQGGSTLYSTTACVVGRTYLLTYTRTGNTGTWYIDGVATNSLTDGINYTLPFANVSFASPYGLHGFCYPLAYNRCLSATEVKALYEAGAPAGADYNSASNTALNTSTVSSQFGGSGTLSSASATGFNLVWTSGNTSYIATQPNLVGGGYVGRKFRYSFTITVNSGTGPRFEFWRANATGNAVILNSLTSGTYSGEYTFGDNQASFFAFVSAAAVNYTVSNLSITALGLLLAPDAAQAGGGLTWNDTSGNGAHIVLPATGVDFNLPSYGQRIVSAKTSTNGNEKLLGANSLGSVNGRGRDNLVRAYARARTGTPTVTLGWSAGNAGIVASVTLSGGGNGANTWQPLTLITTYNTGVGAAALWAGSNSTDIVDWMIVSDFTPQY